MKITIETQQEKAARKKAILKKTNFSVGSKVVKIKVK